MGFVTWILFSIFEGRKNVRVLPVTAVSWEKVELRGTVKSEAAFLVLFLKGSKSFVSIKIIIIHLSKINLLQLHLKFAHRLQLI
jgi:hypothetical protein